MIRRRLAAAFAAGLAAELAAGAPATAGEAQRLQGLFCNTEAQIDRARADILGGLTPSRAADLANRDAVVCTHVDRLHYLIEGPVALGDEGFPLVTYRGALVGVLVGGALRPVSPAAELFFLTPRRVAGAVTERRT
jgi:hypothetical protein